MNSPAAPSSFRQELGATTRLALPLAAANLLQMAVYAIDVMFVARLGTVELAASSLSVSLFGLFVWGFTGLVSAAAPLIAAEIGRRFNAVREVRRSVRMGLWLSALAGLVTMIACSFGEEFMLLAGQEPRIAERAGAFLDILKWAAIPMVAASVLRIFVSALGRPVIATAITAAALLVNAIGNYALVFGNLGAPALGLEGSAIASNITAVIILLAYVGVIMTDRYMRRFHLFGRLWRTDWQRFREIVRIGLPIALTVIAEFGLFGSAAFLMGGIGAAELAAHTIALQIAAFFFQVPFGVSQAATIRVGYFFGRRDHDGIGHAGRAALTVGVGFMGLSALTILAMPMLILSAYVDVTNPANRVMVGLAAQYLLVAAAFQIFDGTQTVAAGILRGLQDTRVPMLMAVGGYWLAGFSTAVILGFFTPLEGLGVWIGLATGLVITAGLLLRRWSARARLRLLPEVSYHY